MHISLEMFWFFLFYNKVWSTTEFKDNTEKYFEIYRQLSLR